MEYALFVSTREIVFLILSILLKIGFIFLVVWVSMRFIKKRTKKLP